MKRDREVRLQRYLASCGVASRRRAEEFISAGRVTVNGVAVQQLGSKVVPGRDEVAVDGEMVVPVELGVVLIYKPTGVVSTMRDPQGRRCIADLLTARYRSYAPVGRLDYESEGLMILTNDGELADHLLHPRYALPRVYEVMVEGVVSPHIIERLENGVKLSDGVAKGRVKILFRHDRETQLEISVLEGRNRLVRRMCDAVGHPVMRLIRRSHGPFKLGTLRIGELRKLSEREYRQRRRQCVSEE